MPREVQAYFFDILQMIETLESFRSTHTCADLEQPTLERLGVERALSNIGEALWCVRKTRPDLIRDIRDADRIIAMRHVLVHGYAEVKTDRLWTVLTEHLMPLRQDIHRVLKEFP